MKLSTAKEIFAQRKEKPCFDLADIYPEDVCFEELRLKNLKSKKSHIESELNDILSMFQQSTTIGSPTKEEPQQKIMATAEDDESDDGKPEFEEKTCTIVQLPVAKLKFSKLNVYQSPSAAQQQAKNKLKKDSSHNDEVLKSVKKPLFPADSPLSLGDKPLVDDILGTPTKENFKERVNNIVEDIINKDEPYLWFNTNNASRLIQTYAPSILDYEEPILRLEVHPYTQLFLNSSTFEIKEVLGEGAYGKVFSAVNSTNGQRVAVKFCDKESGCWEFFVLSKLKDSLHEIPDVFEFAFDAKHAILIMEKLKFSLLDLVNVSASLDELIVMFYLHRILGACIKLWSQLFIHCDLKPEHLMLTFPPVGSKWGGSFEPNGWNDCSLKLIDMGQAINISSINHASLMTNGSTNPKKVTISDDYTRFPWNCQVDFIGIARTIFMMVWKQDFELPFYSSNSFDYHRWMDKVSSMQFKRGWNKEFWLNLFQTLINPVEGDCLQSQLELMVKQASEVLETVEEYLVSESEKNGKSLLFMLKRSNISLLEKYK